PAQHLDPGQGQHVGVHLVARVRALPGPDFDPHRSSPPVPRPDARVPDMPPPCVAHAGSAAWERLPEALARLRPRFGRIPVHPAGDPGDAETLTAELAPEVDVLVVFGGDGTVHEVANGLPLGGDGPLVALLPAGTGNDLARALGMPPDPVAGAPELVGARPRTLDLLDCGPRRAANGVNAGFAAAATDV